MIPFVAVESQNTAVAHAFVPAKRKKTAVNGTVVYTTAGSTGAKDLFVASKREVVAVDRTHDAIVRCRSDRFFDRSENALQPMCTTGMVTQRMNIS